MKRCNALRLLAEKIATAASLAGRGATAILYLADSEKADLAVALHAKHDDRAGKLFGPLLELRAICGSHPDTFADQAK